MPKEYSQAELIEMGKKRVKQMEIDAHRTRARNSAVSQLISKYPKDFKVFYDAALKAEGL